MRAQFWPQVVKGRDQLEDLDVEGRIILEWILEIGCDGVDCIHLDFWV